MLMMLIYWAEVYIL